MADDAYARRQRRKKAGGQGCVVVLLAGVALLAGLEQAVRAIVS